MTTNEIAQTYVKLVLAVGNHDSDYVDAYFGPPELKEQNAASPMSLELIRTRAEELIVALSDTVDIDAESATVSTSPAKLNPSVPVNVTL